MYNWYNYDMSGQVPNYLWSSYIPYQFSQFFQKEYPIQSKIQQNQQNHQPEIKEEQNNQEGQDIDNNQQDPQIKVEEKDQEPTLPTRKEFLPEKQIDKQKLKNRKKFQKDQYRPSTDRKRRKKKHQNQNKQRNLLSNSLHQVFSFTLNRSRSGPLVTQFFTKLKPNSSWTINRFYMYTKLIKEGLHNYLNQKQIQKIQELKDLKYQIYEQQQQKFYIKLTRIIIFHFLRYQANNVILTSARMGSQNRQSHLRIRRHLRQLMDIYDTQ